MKLKKTAPTESQYSKDFDAAMRDIEGMRKDPKNGIDISLSEYAQEKWHVSLDDLMLDLGVNGQLDTISNIVSMPDISVRWLIPEIYREAIRLGLRKAPIYKNLIAGEQTISQLQITFPAINMSDAKPQKVGIAESITLGDFSFQQKTVKVGKIGRGIKIPYEIQQYVAVNVIGIFLEDFGVKLAMGLDTMAINTLLNGDQADGSDSVSTVGITTANTLVFRDLLRIWVRMARMGKNITTIVGGETSAMDMLDLLTTTKYFGTPRSSVELKLQTPLPQNSDFYVHGVMPTSKALMIDKSSALIKLNAQPLLVESEKIIQNQTLETYATLTTGFATLYRDSRIQMDETITFAGNGFPTYLDPTSQENVIFV